MPFDNPPSEVTPITILDDMIQRLATPDRWCKGIVSLPARGAIPERFCIAGAALMADHGSPTAYKGGWAGNDNWLKTDASHLVIQALTERIRAANAVHKYYTPISDRVTIWSHICDFNNSDKTDHATMMKMLTDTRADLTQ